MTVILSLSTAFACGMIVSFVAYKIKRGNLEKLAQTILQKAEQDASVKRTELEVELKQKALEHSHALDKVTESKTQKILKQEEKIEKQLAEAKKLENELQKTKKELLHRQDHIDRLEKEYTKKLENLAGVTPHAARSLLLDQFAQDIKQECEQALIKQQEEIKETADRYASDLIITAINRMSHMTVSDAAIITVSLPNHEMKRRVIGREGRNIRALEQATGVNFIIDDTPNAVIISGFDPLRKEIAKQALTELIQDGRIHPTHIEEIVTKKRVQVQKEIKRFGEEAAFKAGSFIFHPELILLLGKLHFCYNMGQNILTHSLEVSHLMGLMAAELHLDHEKARRIGLLHDIGKAASSEVEGSHALIGEQLALQYGESEEIANGIACHHEECEPTSVEACLISAANHISRSRPGARIEALEQSFKRSAKLEQLSRQFKGVEEAYAMHAGREIRVIVQPDAFDDQSTLLLAREIAKKIEHELSYPGKIKVTVIREKKAVEYAT